MKRKLPSFFRSLLCQMQLRVMCILIVLLFAMGLSQYLLLRDSLYRSADQLLQSRFHNVLIQDLVNIQTPDQISGAAAGLIDQMIETSVNVTIIDSSGQVIDESDYAARDAFGENLPLDEHNEMQKDVMIPHLTLQEYVSEVSKTGIIDDYHVIKNSLGQPFLVHLFKIGDAGNSSGLIQLSTPLQTINSVINQQMMSFLYLSLAVLGAGMTVITLALMKTLRPLRKMTRAVSEIDADSLDAKLERFATPIEVDRLSSAFNKMLERIHASFSSEQKTKAQMQQFLSDASHELKTPLTAIHGLTEVLIMGAAKDEQQLAAALQSILSESERLERMVRELLTLTKLDQQAESAMMPVRLADILSEIRAGAEVMAGQKVLRFRIQDDLSVMANHDHIKQIMLNLIQNAFQHTAEQGEITVRLTACVKEDKTMAVLRVEDDGFGIPRESLDRIFDRFYRVDSHRAREQGGSGLGLAIVKSIVERYGGTIEAESEMGRGTAFTITFPATNTTL